LVHWGEFQATTIDPNQVSSEPFGDSYYCALSPGLTDAKRTSFRRCRDKADVNRNSGV